MTIAAALLFGLVLGALLVEGELSIPAAIVVALVAVGLAACAVIVGRLVVAGTKNYLRGLRR